MEDEFLQSCDLADAERLKAFHTHLEEAGFCITSPKTTRYNCIAYAIGKKDRRWWPDEDDSYWPPGISTEETIDAFMAAFALQGYQVCNDSELELGFEKIAIYVDSEGTPTHAAKQNHLGRWKSKCGKLQNIEHNTLEALGGERWREYGTAKCFMKRPRLDEG